MHSKIMALTVLESFYTVKEAYDLGGERDPIFGLVPLFLAFPYLLRFRQCLIEYMTLNEHKNVSF